MKKVSKESYKGWTKLLAAGRERERKGALRSWDAQLTHCALTFWTEQQRNPWSCIKKKGISEGHWSQEKMKPVHLLGRRTL